MFVVLDLVKTCLPLAQITVHHKANLCQASDRKRRNHRPRADRAKNWVTARACVAPHERASLRADTPITVLFPWQRIHGGSLTLLISWTLTPRITDPEVSVILS